MSDISLTASFGDAPPEKLGFRWVLNIFLRTWPFIRPSLKHLVYFVVLSGLLSLYSLFLLFIVFGLTTTGVVAGDPVGSVSVAFGQRLDSRAKSPSFQSLRKNFRSHNTCSDGLTRTAANWLEPGYFSQGGKSVVILPNLNSSSN